MKKLACNCLIKLPKSLYTCSSNLCSEEYLLVLKIKTYLKYFIHCYIVLIWIPKKNNYLTSGWTLFTVLSIKEKSCTYFYCVNLIKDPVFWPFPAQWYNLYFNVSICYDLFVAFYISAKNYPLCIMIFDWLNFVRSVHNRNHALIFYSLNCCCLLA